MQKLRLITLVFGILALGLGGCGESHSAGDAAADSGGGSDGGGSDGGGSDGGGTDGGGPSCSECGPAEMCCPGCGDEVFCVSGAVCPAVDCPPPPLCGGEICSGTQECCPGCDGASFCADGPGCPDVDCPMPDSCTPMDAYGEGACRALLGYVWDGAACNSIGGCECVGAHCYRLYGSQEDCERATASCTSTITACGTRGAPPCARTEFCDYPERANCGATDIGGTCRPRPETCATIYSPVCGCDGMTYGNACGAHAAGVDDATPGECGTTTDPDP